MNSVTFRGVTVTREDVLRALANLDAQYPNLLASGNWEDPGDQTYCVRVDGRAYSPVAILANATGLPPSDLTGDVDTRLLLHDLGFETVPSASNPLPTTVPAQGA